MIIQMLSNMSSGRHDGRVWPAAWTDFEVPDWEGEDLVSGGNAIKVADSWPDEPEPKFATGGVVVPEPEPETEPVTETPEESELGEPPGETPGGNPSDPPKPAASKQEWIDYAVNQRGAEWIEATNSTKQQLMEQYGQRP